mmetsp:Transcript_25406/g.64598  ORF Transcript_25406/g.64598 Transcript_25406/m.64598 type:complete len:151 (+) Transcript_25406:61-513(+)
MRATLPLLLVALAARGAGALSLVSAAAAGATTGLDGAKGPGSDQVVGHFKGMIDGYVSKYEDEEARFAQQDAAMQQVVEATADMEAKARAVDEKLKLQREHEDKLKGFAGFVRTLSNAVVAMKPTEPDWLATFPDLKAKVDRIFAANPTV